MKTPGLFGAEIDENTRFYWEYPAAVALATLAIMALLWAL